MSREKYARVRKVFKEEKKTSSVLELSTSKKRKAQDMSGALY